MYLVSVITPVATKSFHWGKLASLGPPGHSFRIYAEKLCYFSGGKQIRSIVCLFRHKLPFTPSC